MVEQHQLTSVVEGISCFAWNGDHSMIAISPNSNEIHIYGTKGSDDWQRLFVLSEVLNPYTRKQLSSSVETILSLPHDLYVLYVTHSHCSSPYLIDPSMICW